MFYRVEMDVLNVMFEIDLVPDLVLPIPALPDSLFVFFAT
jgi:hypothetical protein